MKTALTKPAFEFDSTLLKDKSLKGINPFDTSLTEDVKKRIRDECAVNAVYFATVCGVVSDTTPRKLFANVQAGSGRDVSYILERLGDGSHSVTKFWQEASLKASSRLLNDSPAPTREEAPFFYDRSKPLVNTNQNVKISLGSVAETKVNGNTQRWTSDVVTMQGSEPLKQRIIVNSKAFKRVKKRLKSRKGNPRTPSGSQAHGVRLHINARINLGLKYTKALYREEYPQVPDPRKLKRAGLEVVMSSYEFI